MPGKKMLKWGVLTTNEKNLATDQKPVHGTWSTLMKFGHGLNFRVAELQNLPSTLVQESRRFWDNEKIRIRD